jgi:GntR family transcriptional regulator
MAVGTIERDATIPLWSQLQRDLHLRAVRGEFTTRFPSEADLVRQYRVSRCTVREALRRLRADGVLDRDPGRGSRLVGRVGRPAGVLDGLYRAAAGQATATVVEVRAGIAIDAHAATALGLPTGQRLRLVERVRAARGRPLAVERIWLPADGAGRLPTSIGTADVEDVLAACGIVVDAAQERVRVTELADPGIAARVGGAPGDPAIVVDLLLYAARTPVALCRSVLPARMTAELVVSWRSDAGIQITAAATDGSAQWCQSTTAHS